MEPERRSIDRDHARRWRRQPFAPVTVVKPRRDEDRREPRRGEDAREPGPTGDEAERRD